MLGWILSVTVVLVLIGAQASWPQGSLLLVRTLVSLGRG